MKWARTQPEPKPSWLLTWSKIDNGQREVDMQIGEAVAKDVLRHAARQILALDADDRARRSQPGYPNKGPWNDMRTTLRRLARGEPLPEVPDA